ncbi:cyclin [Penicillium chermesinum]|nr:cyclin [Penicillium chermesinum]
MLPEGRNRPAPSEEQPLAAPPPPAVHPSFVLATKAYLTEQDIQNSLRALEIDPTREENARLHGVGLIDRTASYSSSTYFHRFRLVHRDDTYFLKDVAAAALFVACKTEDTLKKSREIVCAIFNVNAPPHEHMTSDHQYFDNGSRVIISLERLMLEAAGFDFRTRHPQKLMHKLTKHFNVPKAHGITASLILLDTYRTYVPLKMVPVTMAFASLELAGRLENQRSEQLEKPENYALWHTSREEIMGKAETLFDLLEMYTHSRVATHIGDNYPADRFLTVRIPLNQEAKEKNYPRYTGWVDEAASKPQTPAHPLLPVAANREPYQAETAKNYPVRYIFDPAIAEAEGLQVSKFFELEEEQYEAEE